MDRKVKLLVAAFWIGLALFLAYACFAPALFAHDNYTGIFNKAGNNCCNGKDCHTAHSESEFVIKMTGGYVLKRSGEFIPEKLTGDSPDGNWHICRTSDAPYPVRCLLIPPGGS